jgi:hypothetical protein
MRPAQRRPGRKTDFRHSSAARTNTYGMDASAMQLVRVGE